ncbi:MAG: hypothetical protein U0414_23200 [Polyangiaceae bacterium]
MFAAHGCNSSDEPPIEDYCSWLAHEDNCFRLYGEDVLTTTPTAPRCTNLSKAAAFDGKLQTGSFQTRATLDKCFMTEGGAVTFDPPIDLAALPIVSDVVIKMTNADESDCGTVTWADVDRFTIDIKPDVNADGGALTEDQVSGGVFFFQRKVGRKTVSTSCPSGESHYFDLFQIAKCPDLTNVQPRAELNIVSGGLRADGTPAQPGDDPLLTKTGSISLKIFYQPTTGALSGAQSAGVEYFKCFIPPPPERCADGIQNGDETDVDCGGKSTTGMSGPCDRCEDGAKCIENSDCVSGKCESKMGVRKCAVTPDPATSSSSAASSSSTGP